MSDFHHQIPTIARMEWHPFTISSAPENRDELWLHIRSAGHWTNRLYEYFDKLGDEKDKSKATTETDVEAGEGSTALERTQSQTAAAERRQAKERGKTVGEHTLYHSLITLLMIF